MKGVIEMFDYEYLFAMSLHARLKENVVGRVYITVTKKDELYVRIESYGGLIFDWSVGDFSTRILNGYTSEYASYDVMKKYKKFIMKKYFN